MPSTEQQLLVTKTRLPQLPLDWVARPRLSQKLSDALLHKFVLLSAPAGYGKTTLVVETIRDLQKRVGWVSLDETDDAPQNFLAYLIAALQTVVPGICQPLLNALQSPQPPPMDWLLTALVNSVSGYEDDLILVLDDYHAIGSQAVHEVVCFLVERLPPQVHLVIASRIDPPLPLSRWRVRGELAEIRATDLGFTVDEASAFFDNATGVSLSDEDLATLAHRRRQIKQGNRIRTLSGYRHGQEAHQQHLWKAGRPEPYPGSCSRPRAWHHLASSNHAAVAIKINLQIRLLVIHLLSGLPR